MSKQATREAANHSSPEEAAFSDALCASHGPTVAGATHVATLNYVADLAHELGKMVQPLGHTDLAGMLEAASIEAHRKARGTDAP